jgi:hypothetical protein
MIRVLCAFLAIVLFLGGTAALVIAPSALFLIPIFAAAALAIVAMSGPPSNDLARIEDQLRRFRTAMFACFAAAILGLRGGRPLALLAVALWLVGFVLFFFVAYYRAQRRMTMAGE